MPIDERRIRDLTLPRRRFLRDVGVGGAVLTAASLASPVGRFVPDAWGAGRKLDDTAIVTFSMGVEYAAVAAYEAISATKKVTGELATNATTFATHHQDHGDAFATIITAADADKKPNAKLLTALRAQVRQAADQKALTEVARTIEESLAATHLFALGLLKDKVIAETSATVLPVESQHAVVLGLAAGTATTELVPSFETSTKAISTTTYPA